jgi:rare lipoprotein A
MLRHQHSGIRVSAFQLAASMAMLLALAGCSHKKPQVARVPPPPSIDYPRPSQPSTTVDARHYPPNARPLYVETGVASWYGPPYSGRKAATGEIFDMNVPTAAHKTLPLNSIVRVTNLKTGKSIVVRINDRGPFVGDRVLDLSMAAAKAIDVYRAGLATVKIELLETPAPLDTGGRWCVQIGAFTDSDEATQMKSKLMRKYQAAKVIQFAGPTGDWVRIRPPQDDRKKAFEMAHDVRSSEGGVFLVRLD